MALTADLKEFPNLSHTAFQHQADRQATESLKKVPLLPQFTRFLSEKIAERYMRIKHTSSSIKVGPNQYPSLYKQYVRMAQVLDVRKLPSLHISTEMQINAFAMGMENYSIVVCSALIDIMTEDELLAIIGHELGHVKCDHVLYNSAANVLRNFGTTIIEQALPMGMGQVASLGIQLALLDWSRKAELSCDRAALLATQNPEAVAGALGKLAGYSKHLQENINLEEVKIQAAQYHEIGEDSLIDKMMKLYLFVQETHPYPTVRVKEITGWAESEDYKNILNGQYRKLGEETKLKLVGQKLTTPRGKLCPNPKCQQVSTEDDSFCSYCSANLRGAQLACGQCSKPVDQGWKMCANCGNQLILDQIEA
ncbi:MAG: M48 family metallopeptidase [Acidobacteria bacterium]|nr:M48 family metallopeptidase [Acidobacteriota bacterium]